MILFKHQINMFDNIVLKLNGNKEQSKQIGLDQGDEALDASPLSLHRCSTISYWS
jgi:hypothetical protein